MIAMTLGAFMCGAIPQLQVYGILVSSVAVVAIALDRYRNVVQVMNKRWNPSLWLCITFTIILWIICAAISYPMNTFYSYEPVKVLYGDMAKPEDLYCKLYWMCVGFQKDSLAIYHISLTVIIFSPLVCVFIWMYWNIAHLVWVHRKPVTSVNSNSFENSFTKSTDIDPGLNIKTKPKIITIKKKNLHVERKIRSFKIIIVLILVFILCRLPYWIYFIVRLCTKLPGTTNFGINYVIISLSLLNCALNPFIYTFVTSYLIFVQKIHELFCKICSCCFCFSDFEELVKDNPFVVSNVALSGKNMENKSNNSAEKKITN